MTPKVSSKGTFIGHVLVRDKSYLYLTLAELDHVNTCLGPGPGPVVSMHLFSLASEVGSGLGLFLSHAKLHL